MPGSININKPGRYTLEVQALTLVGLYAGNLVYVLLSGAAIEGATEFVISPRASYIGFIWHKTENCTWFYNCIKISQSFPGTQFSVCGIDQIDIMLLHNDVGQGNYVMFSCLGQYRKDPEDGERSINVPNYGRPLVITKEKAITKRHFKTDEGGAHCSLTYPWKLNEQYHALLKIDTTSWEDDVVFTAFFYLNEEKRWKKIAAYKLPCERPDLISGMHSTIRDFYRRHGRYPREAVFGPAWRRKADGNWKELNGVSFFQDGNESNIDVGVAKDGKSFHLVTGGFTQQSSNKQDFECKKSDQLPEMLKILPD
uniref:Uncharacterized protein n=1 Tax=Strigamia maritima TaxID=126957 RepID=T1IPN9_STRMM